MSDFDSWRVTIIYWSGKRKKFFISLKGVNVIFNIVSLVHTYVMSLIA